MKKIITVLIVAALLLTIMPTAAFAHGRGGASGGGTQAIRRTVCYMEDCIKTGLHIHNNKTYAAHFYGDGHIYHDYCPVEDCVFAGYHEHDGIYCFGHAENDGHGHHGSGHRGAGHH